MHLLNLLRGHFALLEGKTLTTISENSPFTVVRAIPKTPRQWATWLIEIKPGKAKTTTSIYYADMLRVYAWLAERDGRWCTFTDLSKAKLVYIGSGTESYLIPLLATLDDVEIGEDEKGKPAVRVNYPER